ncbi:hypothetical protein BD408DRAFT_431979 [Parasitella parasitica]|nr:hypothetical protein BD408DRAFT_431979 [Parasitella parasitica]
MKRINEFPSEIISKIFTYLTFSEKKSCASTCRKWQNLILHSNFYEDLQIEGEEKFTLFNQYFQKEENKLYRNQIRRLGIKVHFRNADQANALLALPEIHPNLQELVWENATRYDIDESDTPKIVVNENIAEHWKRITSFQDRNKYFLSSKILEYGGFCNLVELRVVFVGNERSEFKCNLLIQHLSNAPKLKTLRLEHGAMSLSHLHQLHCNAQQLEALWLQDMELANVGVNEQRPLISPNNTLKELRIFDCSKEYNENMLQHMKYPNLQTLRVCFSKRCYEMYGENQLAEFVSHCPYLETYNVGMHPITPAIMGAIDASGAKLKNISITIWPEEDPLRQFKDVLKSNQKDSVHTMNTNYSYIYPFDKAKVKGTFDTLEAFPSLKNLDIASIYFPSSHHFPLSNFLRKNLHLETLRLTDWNIENSNPLKKLWNDFSSEFKTTMTIKNLILDNVHCENEEFVPLISKTCPKLSKLTIFHDFNHELCNYEFPNHSFASITVIGPHNCYYQVTTEKETKCYKFVKGVLQKTCKESPDSTNSPIFSLKYKSCKVLKIGNAYIDQP